MLLDPVLGRLSDEPLNLVILTRCRHEEASPWRRDRGINKIRRGIAQERQAGASQATHGQGTVVLDQDGSRATSGVVGELLLGFNQDDVFATDPFGEKVGGAHSGDATTDDSNS